MRLSDRDFVGRRHGDAPDLSARIVPRQRYGINGQPSPRRVFDRFARPPNGRAPASRGSVRITKL